MNNCYHLNHFINYNTNFFFYFPSLLNTYIYFDYTSVSYCLFGNRELVVFNYGHVLDICIKDLENGQELSFVLSKYELELSKTDRYFLQSLFNKCHISDNLELGPGG